MVPLLLRSWLKPSHIHQYFDSAAIERAPDSNVASLSATSFLYLADVAKSSSVLLAAEISIEDSENLAATSTPSQHSSLNTSSMNRQSS
jgi:hypothetical protein